MVAKVEWHPPASCAPRVGFIVTNLSRPRRTGGGVYNHRGDSGAVHQGRQIRHQVDPAVMQQVPQQRGSAPVHALAYNLGNFMRTLALPKEVEHWSLTTLREKLVKIGAKVVRHGRYVTFQLAEVAVSKILFQKILALIDDLRRSPVPRRPRKLTARWKKTGEVCLDGGNLCQMAFRTWSARQSRVIGGLRREWSSRGGAI